MFPSSLLPFLVRSVPPRQLPMRPTVEFVRLPLGGVDRFLWELPRSAKYVGDTRCFCGLLQASSFYSARFFRFLFSKLGNRNEIERKIIRFSKVGGHNGFLGCDMLRGGGWPSSSILDVMTRRRRPQFARDLEVTSAFRSRGGYASHPPSS